MAVTLSAKYQAELRKGVNQPNTIVELSLTGGTRKWGMHDGGFPDVELVLDSVSSLQNVLDTKKGYSTRGKVNVVIEGRTNFKNLIRDEYLKNRRIAIKQGFVVDGFTYADYADVFTGKILDWKRKGDRLTLTMGDDLLVEGKTKLPVENDTKTQSIDYRNTNAVDVMLDILTNHLGLSTAIVDVPQFESERDTWLSGYNVNRVLTKPEAADKILNDLQVETNSFIVHDGEKISLKYFGPTLPGQTTPKWNDDDNIDLDTITQESGYNNDHFFNRLVIAYDYDENGGDVKLENFESRYIAIDAGSQSTAKWDEATTRTIKAKWLKSFTHTQTTNMTGVDVFHTSFNNSTGIGVLDYNSTFNTLTYTAPGGVEGNAVTLNNSGKFRVNDEDVTKYVRVNVETSSLPVIDKTDNITLAGLQGGTQAKILGNRLLQRYRDPVMQLGFSIDLNDGIVNSKFIKPTDLIDITTDEACEKDKNTLVNERMMLTKVRPNFSNNRLDVEVIKTALPSIDSVKWGFIAPSGFPDYSSASISQREYAFIGRASDNKVFDGSTFVEGYSIW